MKKQRILRNIGIIVLSALSIGAQAFGAEEIKFKPDITIKKTLETNRGISPELLPPVQESISLPIQRPELLAANETIRAEQILVPNVKIDLGVSKEESKIDIQNNALDETTDKTGPTFIERITKEEYRPGPVQLFNKNGYEFESGPIKNLKLGFYYLGTGTMLWPDRQWTSTKWKNGAAELTVITKFRNDKTSARVVYNFLRDIDGHPNKFMEKFSELGIAHEFNKNNQVHVGQTWRLPIGVEGYLSPFNQDLPTKAQIGRTFSDTRSFGVRNIGNYKYVNYDIGLYDSTRYWTDFGNGVDFTGWVNFKPLANLDSKKYGSLTMGTGISTGKNLYSYTVAGGYLGYDYKRFHNKFEYSHANGYNAGGQSRNEAEGFYNTVVIDLTKNLKLIGRYDFFNPNLLKNKSAAEYTGGLTYVFKNGFKVGVAYTYKQVNNGAHSNAISLQTQVKL